MKNTNNKEIMKKFMKMAFAVVAFAAVGLGSYKAYGSYTAANMSEEDLLMAENVEALSRGVEPSCSSYQTNGCGAFRGQELSCTTSQTWQCCQKDCD